MHNGSKSGCYLALPRSDSHVQWMANCKQETWIALISEQCSQCDQSGYAEYPIIHKAKAEFLIFSNFIKKEKLISHSNSGIQTFCFARVYLLYNSIAPDMLAEFKGQSFLSLVCTSSVAYLEPILLERPESSTAVLPDGLQSNADRVWEAPGNISEATEWMKLPVDWAGSVMA